MFSLSWVVDSTVRRIPAGEIVRFVLDAWNYWIYSQIPGGVELSTVLPDDLLVGWLTL